MIFFDKAWKDDIPAVQLVGILFCVITLFVYPVPQMFASSAPAVMLGYVSAAGTLFVLFSLWLLCYLNSGKSIGDLVGITVPDKKTVAGVGVTLPCTLLAVGAITWHWKYTLNKLDIPFVQTQKLLEYADISKPLVFSLLILMAVIVVPIVEEFVFRRVLFELTAKATGFNAAGFITAGVFSAAHGFLAGAPGLFLMGVILQWMYSKHRNLAACIMLHGLCNAVAIICVAVVKNGGRFI